MKSFPTPGAHSIETIIFPKHKIRPYLRASTLEISDIMESPQQMLKRAKSHLHLLEVTEPHLLLQKIFQPYLILVKILGSHPLRIENGCAKFKFLSWNVAYSLIVFVMFNYDTYIFLPIMQHLNSEQVSDFMMYVTEIILVLSQVFAAQMSYVFMAVQARKLASFWNRLQAILVKLVARCPNHLDLLPAYRSARMKIIVWILFAVELGVCYIVSFYDDLRTYLEGQNYSTIYSWTLFTGFFCYAVLLSIHILHSTCFTTFTCVLCSCFQTLGNIALKQDGKGEMLNAQSPVLFQETSEIYEELVALTNLLGGIYGIYMGLEILAMIICATINCYFLISMPFESSLVLLNAAILMPYMVWFHKLCSSAAELNLSMKQCYRNFKKAVSNAGSKISLMDLVQLQQIEAPECVSAAGYFLIDMNLFTTVLGTIATYIVITIQFGAGFKNDGAAGLSSLFGASFRNSTS